MNLGERGLFIHFSSVKSLRYIKRKKGEKLIGRKSLIDILVMKKYHHKVGFLVVVVGFLVKIKKLKVFEEEDS